MRIKNVHYYYYYYYYYHAKTVHKGKKVAFAMVRERNQSQMAFFTKSSTELQL